MLEVCLVYILHFQNITFLSYTFGTLILIKENQKNYIFLQHYNCLLYKMGFKKGKIYLKFTNKSVSIGKIDYLEIFVVVLFHN